ncbi:transglutaminase domain-containing protein [Candidatus Bipolaricaulota bacterium]
MTQPMTVRDDVLDFYRTQTPFTDPGSHADRYDELSEDLAELCATLQGLMIHMFWIGEQTYGVTRGELKAKGRDIVSEINLRTAEERLGRILELDPSSLSAPRGATARVVGNCRDYSLLLVSILRHRGIPARVRSGVARYFFPDSGFLEDHLICEFWNAEDERWQQTDAQIDDVQKAALKLEMDMIDLPRDEFLCAAEAYRELKEGRKQPKEIGFPPDFCGYPYVRYKLFSDLACITGQETLPFEGWGLGSQSEPHPGDDALMEDVAGLLLVLNDEPQRLRVALDLMQTHPRLACPQGYKPKSFQEEWLG